MLAVTIVKIDATSRALFFTCNSSRVVLLNYTLFYLNLQQKFTTLPKHIRIYNFTTFGKILLYFVDFFEFCDKIVLYRYVEGKKCQTCARISTL